MTWHFALSLFVQLVVFRVIVNRLSKFVSSFLELLEALVRSAGPAVHNAVGKFRFLNELIKLVSPKVRHLFGTDVLEVSCLRISTIHSLDVLR